MLNLTRQAAAAKAEKLGCSPYEALMDQYEAGAREADIDRVFADYGAFLPEFLPRVLEHQARRGKPIEPKGPFPQSVQKDLAKRLMQGLGFDFKHGRLDESHHPFCGGVPEDVRITTRYSEDHFVQALMGVIHETGHALYERNLPAEWRLQPVGQARGMTVHESQSLLMEMQAARSAQFCKHLSGLLRETFPGNDAALSPENLQLIYSRVQPGFIRVDADEVTYPAHVILRYGIEKALFRGDLQLADVPGVWNAEFKKLLGLDVPSDREGVLQDVHWYDGAFGYFPCYSLGAMTAAQLFEAACAAHPGNPGGDRAGQVHHPAGLAEDQRPRPRLQPLDARTRHPRHRPPARRRRVQAAPGAAVSELSVRPPLLLTSPRTEPRSRRDPLGAIGPTLERRRSGPRLRSCPG